MSTPKTVLDVVRHKPGRTAREIAESCGLDVESVLEQIPRLTSLGLIRTGHPRRCLFTRQRRRTLWPVTTE